MNSDNGNKIKCLPGSKSTRDTGSSRPRSLHPSALLLSVLQTGKSGSRVRLGATEHQGTILTRQRASDSTLMTSPSLVLLSSCVKRQLRWRLGTKITRAVYTTCSCLTRTGHSPHVWLRSRWQPRPLSHNVPLPPFQNLLLPPSRSFLWAGEERTATTQCSSV